MKPHPIDLPDDDDPPFRHWVDGDYPEDDRDDGTNFFRGLINGLLLTALFVAVGYGFWIITP